MRTRRIGGVLAGVAIAATAPAVVAAHQLSAVFQSRLPLEVYLSGAAAAVALSFAFVLLRDVRAAPPPDAGRALHLPSAVDLALRTIGLIGWLWIVVQAVLGGDSAAEVPRLFVWVYAWVAIPIVTILVGPIWHWLDPFATLFDLLGRAARAVGIGGLEAVAYPERLGRWPAVAGFAAVVWFELVASGGSPRTLGFVVLGYTVYTVAMMAQFGRDTWRANGEVFSVWFGLLSRLAQNTLAPDGTLRRVPFASGLLRRGWTLPDLVLIAMATGGILFDGLSQTAIWVRTFGLPGTGVDTLLLLAFLGIIVGAALLVARLVGVAATAAGLLPIAAGYLVAHYLTYLAIDGQRIVVAISDPFQRGWDLFGTAFYEPSAAWLPPALVWTIQLAAVVGGHMLGAWAGHVVAARSAMVDAAADRRTSDAAGRAVPRRGRRQAGDDERTPSPLSSRELRIRQIPLAMIMVGLTTLTLWSLGQALFITGA